MPQNSKVLLTLPQELLHQVDSYCEQALISRSEFIRQSVKQMLLYQHNMKMRDQMRSGYLQMAAINTEWAELGLASDEAILSAYEKKLSECE